MLIGKDSKVSSHRLPSNFSEERQVFSPQTAFIVFQNSLHHWFLGWAKNWGRVTAVPWLQTQVEHGSSTVSYPSFQHPSSGAVSTGFIASLKALYTINHLFIVYGSWKPPVKWAGVPPTVLVSYLRKRTFSFDLNFFGYCKFCSVLLAAKTSRASGRHRKQRLQQQLTATTMQWHRLMPPPQRSDTFWQSLIFPLYHREMSQTQNSPFNFSHF